MKLPFAPLAFMYIPSIILLYSCSKNESVSRQSIIPANYKTTGSNLSAVIKPVYRMLPSPNFSLNKVVDIAGSSANDSAAVVQWDWLNYPSQKWTAEKISGNFYKVINSFSGKALTAPGNTSGTPLIQAAYTGSTSQYWKMASAGAGNAYTLINNNGMAAALQSNSGLNGTPIIEDTKNNSATQSFVIQKLFNNPLRTSGADPWVIEHNGYYYYTNTTGFNITLYKTKNMSALGNAKAVVVYTPPAGQPYSSELWAPEMHFLDGKWYIYFTADNGSDYNHRIYVLENSADDPTTGTWTMKGKISDASDIWAIDASILEYGNKRYLLWSGWRVQNSSQYGIQQLYIAEMQNPWTLAGQRHLISEPTYNWETVGLVNEGPEILKNAAGTVFLVYSCCGCWTDEYKLGMLTLAGTDPLIQSNWNKRSTPAFQGNTANSVYAPGHNSFFISPDGSESWILYHANSAAAQGCGGFRSPRMQPFTWNGDSTPNFGVPVSTAESLPAPSGEKL